MELSNKQISNLSFENKWRIYFNYLWIQLRIIHEPLEIDVTSEEYLNKRKYPILLPNKYQVKSRFTKNNIRSFENFCNEKDDRVSEGILGHYWRFKKDIKLIL